MKLIKLFRVKYTRSIQHHVSATIVLREGNAITDTVKTSHQTHETIKTKGKTCMRRCTVLEGIDQETELSHCTFWCETKYLEHLLLKLPIVDTKRATANLNTIADKVVSYGTNLLRSSIKQRYVIGIRHRKRMVCCHQALFLITPLEKREVNNPKADKVVLVTKTETIAHFQTERTELHTSLISIIATENQHEIAILGTHSFLHFSPNFRLIELIDAGLHSTIFIELHIDKALGSNLRTLDKVSQLIELLTGIISTARHADTTNIVGLIENRESACTLQLIHQFHKLHTKTKIGLVASKTTHGLMPRHPLQRWQLNTTNLLKQMASHILEQLEHILLLNE